MGSPLDIGICICETVSQEKGCTHLFGGLAAISVKESIAEGDAVDIQACAVLDGQDMILAIARKFGDIVFHIPITAACCGITSQDIDSAVACAATTVEAYLQTFAVFIPKHVGAGSKVEGAAF